MLKENIWKEVNVRDEEEENVRSSVSEKDHQRSLN